jgi:predicted DNA-binding WGR domain protein
MIILRKRDPSQNMARFYALDLQPSLYGETILIRRWGRIGTYGQRREDWFSDASAAAAALAALLHAKIRRGYSLSAGDRMRSMDREA